MSESLEEKISNIRRAAYEKFSKPVDNDVWVRDVLDDAVIIQVAEDTFKAGYTVADDNSVKFADRDTWEKVELKYVSVKESQPYELQDGVLTIFRAGVPLGPFGDAYERQALMQ